MGLSEWAVQRCGGREHLSSTVIRVVHQHAGAAATPWLCTWAAPTLAFPRPTHTRAKEAVREMTRRASDGSDSYSYIWSVAACGSAISGEASCAAEG